MSVKKITIAAIMVGLLFTAVQLNLYFSQRESLHQVAQPQIRVPVDLEIEERNQDQVDQGHSPWQLEPVHVVITFVSLEISPQGIEGGFPITADDLTVVHNDGREAVVAVSSKETAITRVYLQKLVRQDDSGIWTVVGYDLNGE